MADAFSSELSEVQAPRGPSFIRGSQGPRTETSVLGLATTLFGTILSGVADISATQRELAGEEEKKDVLRRVDVAVQSTVDATMDRLAKIKGASEQKKSITSSNFFNITLRSEIKQLIIDLPGNEELIRKTLRDRGLAPGLQLVESQVEVEDKLEAAKFAREQTAINQMFEAGLAIFNDNGEVDREATIDVAISLSQAQAATAAAFDRMGAIKKPSGEVGFTLRPSYIAKLPGIKRNLFIESMILVRSPLNKLNELIKAGDLEGAKSLLTQAISDMDGFRLEQVKNSLNLNEAEAENYMGHVDDILISITQGILGFSEIKDINQLNGLALVLDFTTKNSELLNAIDLPTLFRLALLSPDLSQTLLNLGLLAGEGRQKISREIAKELKSLYEDKVSPVRDPPVDSLPKPGSGEAKHSTVTKIDRLQSTSDVVQDSINKGRVVQSSEDAYFWLANIGPWFNAFTDPTDELSLSPNDKKGIVGQMTHPNYLINLRQSEKFHPKSAAAVGSFSFDMVQQDLFNTVRELRNFPFVGSKGENFEIKFDSLSKRFEAVPLGKTLRQSPDPSTGKPRADVVVGSTPISQAVVLLGGITERIDRINKAVPFLLETREFKDVFKGTNEIDFMEDLKVFIQGDVTTFGQKKKEGNSTVTPELAANLWGVAFQGEDDVDKKENFVRLVNKFKNNADPNVVSTIVSTVEEVFSGDEGTNVDILSDVMVKIALVESNGFTERVQRGGGPARGIHQVEPTTAVSLISNSTLLGPKAKEVLKREGFDIEKGFTTEELEQALLNDVISTVFATAKLLSGAKAAGQLNRLGGQ